MTDSDFAKLRELAVKAAETRGIYERGPGALEAVAEREDARDAFSSALTPAVVIALVDKAMEREWRTIESAPKDGTWILAINNRGNQAVIIWRDDAFDEGDADRIRGQGGWIHPFTTGYRSTFWNGGCGSVPTHWQPLPPAPIPSPKDGEA